MGKSYRRSEWDDEDYDYEELERLREANSRRARKRSKRNIDALEESEEDA